MKPAGGAFKPGFGLSGAVRRLDRVLPLLARFRAVYSDFDFNSPLTARCVIEKAAPRPAFGPAFTTYP